MLTAIGETDQGVDAYRNALTYDARQPAVWNNLAVALCSRRQVAEGLRCFEQALALTAGFPTAHSNYLLALNYAPSFSPEAVYKRHRNWAAAHGSNERRARWRRGEWRGRRIRVGYVSGSLYAHSTAHFLEPLLAAHDRGSFEIACYSNSRRADEVTERLRRLCDIWRDIAGLSDDDACALIDADGIDILVDLSGHTEGNRLTVFAKKPAPIQAAWLGYPNTTGLDAIDYRLTSAETDPPGAADQLYSEKLVRLEGSFLCYQPPRGAPAVMKPRSASRGHVTFGCFNNVSKITDEALHAWAAILDGTPGSRLALKSRGFESERLRNETARNFEALGIDPRRIDMLEFQGAPADHFALYADVDIMLDTWPYNGTTMICEALWMVVPVITMAGQVHASRVGLSLLTAVGLPQFVAHSAEDYVRKAAALAADGPQIAELRSALRERMAHSELMDGSGFARRVEDAYRRMMEAAYRGCANSTY